MKNSITLSALAIALFAIGCQQASDQPATATTTPAAPATTGSATPAATPDATAAATPSSTPAAAPAAGSFAGVEVILTTSCMPCHSAAGHKGGLDVTSYDSVMKEVTAGDPDKSKLVKLISGPHPMMPKNGAPLSADKVTTIRDWIKAGAKNG